MPASFLRGPSAAGALLLLAACTAPPAPRPLAPLPGAEAGEAFHALIGLRRMESAADWAPNDDLGFGGLNYTTGPGDQAWRWDFGFFYAADQARRRIGGVADQLETRQLDARVGALYLLPTPARGFQPYAGLGAALLWMESDFRDRGERLQDQDVSVGATARAGFWLDFQPHEHIGLDLSWIGAADADIAGDDRRSHSWTLALIFGYRF